MHRLTYAAARKGRVISQGPDVNKGRICCCLTAHHMWQVAKAVTVEPATGRQQALADAPYDGVEAFWT